MNTFTVKLTLEIDTVDTPEAAAEHADILISSLDESPNRTYTIVNEDTGHEFIVAVDHQGASQPFECPRRLFTIVATFIDGRTQQLLDEDGEIFLDNVEKRLEQKAEEMVRDNYPTIPLGSALHVVKISS